MRSVLAIVIGAALAVIVVACGGGSKKTANAPLPGTTSADAGTMPIAASPQRTRIDELDKKIDAAFAGWNTPRPAPALTADPEPTFDPSQVKSTTDPKCKPGPGPTCGDTCTLADSICDNAGEICKIADELGNDAYAKGKCTSGKASCKAAHERCCGCL